MKLGYSSYAADMENLIDELIDHLDHVEPETSGIAHTVSKNVCPVVNHHSSVIPYHLSYLSDTVICDYDDEIKDRGFLAHDTRYFDFPFPFLV